jgi:hypothetical protein
MLVQHNFLTKLLKFLAENQIQIMQNWNRLRSDLTLRNPPFVKFINTHQDMGIPMVMMKY